MRSLKSWQKRLRSFLFPFSLAYAALMRIRALMYAQGLFRSWTPPVPTISVGNIRWGGVGKTPLCSWILSWCELKKIKPVVLTRGYKASPPQLPWLVTTDSSAELSGDEPLLLAASHPQASIVVDPCRKRSGKWATDKLNPEILLLDDGFQHLAVHRHIDLVVLNIRDLAEDWNKVIPAGPWREDISAFHRATAFLINVPQASVNQPLLDNVHSRLVCYHRPFFFFSLKPEALTDLHGQYPRTNLCGAPYLLVSGIANPERVLTSTTGFLGYPPLRHLAFPDHHLFSEQDRRQINSTAANLGCAHILCTPKDAVKIKKFDPPCWLTFRLKLFFFQPRPQAHNFPEWFENTLKTIQKLA